MPISNKCTVNNDSHPKFTPRDLFRQLRALVKDMIKAYKSATSKAEKGYILSVIVDKIRSNAGIGGFIKKDPKNDQWYDVGDFLAREKVSQAFRDALSDKYKSSTAYKKKRREVEQTGQLFDEFLKETEPTSLKTNSSMKKSMGSNEHDSSTESLFDLLDQSLNQHFQQTHPFQESSVCIIDPFEPTPITESRFSGAFSLQNNFNSTAVQNSVVQPRGGPTSLEPTPIVTPPALQALDMLQLLRMVAQQSVYQLNWQRES